MPSHPILYPGDLPSGSWDAHTHTFDPVNHPFIPNPPYRPPPCPPSKLIKDVPCDNFCIVMAVPEGSDPTLALKSTKELTEAHGRRARTTLILDFDKVSEADLRAYHEQGARGVRINEKNAMTERFTSKEQMRDYVVEVARRVAPLGWSIDLQLQQAQYPALASTLIRLHEELGVHFIINHCFYLHPRQIGSDLWRTCMELLESGAVYVKVSGLDRIMGNNEIWEMEPVCTALVRAHGGDRCLFGSDWPHIISGDMEGNLLPIDTSIELAYHKNWLTSEELERLMVKNPEKLYNW